MRKMNILMLAFALIIMGQLQPSTVQALSCAEIPAIEEAYKKYDGVVVGYVHGLDEKRNYNEIKVTVDKSFKGIQEKDITFHENKTWGNLNGPSEVGEQYLFFLTIKDGNWENPLCSPSMKMVDASEELAFLKDKEIQLSTNDSSNETTVEKGNGEEPPSEVRPALENESVTDSASISWIAVVIMACLIMILLLGVIRKRSK